MAVQALARVEDRAVATSTRNLLRALGSVFGVAISTAAQRAAMQSALRHSSPLSITQSESLSGQRDRVKESSDLGHPRNLDAKMAGFRIVFVSLVPLISLCFVGNFLVSDVTLSEDCVNKEVLIDEGVLCILNLLNILRFKKTESFGAKILNIGSSESSGSEVNSHEA